MTRDHCSPTLTLTTNPKAKTITEITVTTTNNTCGAPIPVTVPGSVTNTQGFTTEQIGTGMCPSDSAQPMLNMPHRSVDNLGYHDWRTCHLHLDSSRSVLKVSNHEVLHLHGK
jgi:hypothetical protein